MSRDADIVSYLLGDLDADGRAAVERRIATDARFAAEVDRMRPVVTGLEEMPGLGWGVEPPPLPDLPDLAPARSGGRRSSALVRPMLAVAASLVALAAGIGIGAWVAGGDDDGARGPALALDRLGPASADAHGEARLIDGDDAGLRVSVAGLAPSDAGEFYELWLLDGPDRIVSLGSFQVPASGATEVSVPLPLPVDDFAFIDVSVEQEDGDPGHSGVSVLRGPTAST